jgi:N6-adenosine-specific RNA methylase IME4
MTLASTTGEQLALFTFEQLEEVIARGLRTFVEVGWALMRIRDERLYRDHGYSDFDTYCRQRWGWQRAHAYRQIEAAKVAATLSPIGDSPQNEGQARELVPLLDQPDELTATWQQLREEHGDRLTAEKVREAVQVVVRRDRIAEARQRQPDPAVAPPLPTGRYRAIVIDPPWPIEKIEREAHPDQGKALDYPTMSLDEIGGLPVPDLAEDGCHIYLWVTHRFLPAGLDLLDGWGARYQCVLTWRKNFGFTPFSWMYTTEHVLFGRIGSLPLERNGLRLDFDAPVTRHSAKPDVFYERVCQASPGPRLAMFERGEREGFQIWGNEVANAS